MKRLLLVLLLFISYLTHAQTVVLNNPDQTFDNLDGHLTALEVRPKQKLTIDSLLQYPEHYRFAPYNRVLNTQRAYWFRITLTNITPNNFFLRIRNLYYDVLVYETVGKTLLRQTRLSSKNNASAKTNSRFSQTLVPLQVRNGQAHQIYLYIDHGTQLQSQLYSFLALAQRIATEELYYGIYYGLVLLTALYSLLLFAKLGDQDNLIYALWVLLFGAFMANLIGHTKEWLGPWQQILSRYSSPFSLLPTILQCIFTMLFLSIRRYAPRLYRIGQGLTGLLSLSIVVSVVLVRVGFPDPIREGAWIVFYLLPYAYILTTAIVTLRRGNKAAWYLLLGQLSLLTSIIYSSFLAIGLVPQGSWSFLSIHIGSAVEIFCFTLGLTYKVNLLKKHQDEAITEQLRLTQANRVLIETQNRVLEEKVEQRTAELRASQAQLIQKEKLASLGELTAGIAHEIQNPLNFVNNFSEVSTELVDELKEGPLQHLPDTEKEYAQEIVSDLTQNLQKIHHHGYRASAIVKGMLEHSRASTGEKQPTNLNALADEYLRLAYQGQRAKNKAFNCQLITEFASDLPSVSVVAQDIGRVLLNLYNNAFYAIGQRAKQGEDGYEPTVWVSIRQEPGRVVICVKDNGTGIPKAIQDKVFQPFFTTKPTGEGTGLGLSLSYDIITKGHGGTMKVESVENEGAEFVITLPC